MRSTMRFYSIESDGRKSHDRAGSFTGSHGAWRPDTAGATAGAMAKGDLSRKDPMSVSTRVMLTAPLSLSAFRVGLRVLFDLSYCLSCVCGVG